ncbi:MAG: PIG-L family deacetylase [Candidatus Nanopelagicales bacterium]|nr:PIG-L family deacetylase [Candidatus Nanopelagicales bacterium]
MKTLVVAPHPDDEMLGAGGTLLRRKSEGGTVGWLVVTALTSSDKSDLERKKAREVEIENVRIALGLDVKDAWFLNYPTTRLDTVPMGELVAAISQVMQDFQPEEVLVPFWGDAHTDHRIVFDAVAACTKWFRYPSIKRVLAYETLSETDSSIGRHNVFDPNVFVDISDWMEEKIQILHYYQSELGEFPFPRSEEAVRALGQVRGAASGFPSAEAFILLKERC